LLAPHLTPDQFTTAAALALPSIEYIEADPMYTFIPGVTIFLLVLAINLPGRALREGP
jgi:ABC-type dipeptide/oligopeptide/nickel transport system permease subunit